MDAARRITQLGGWLAGTDIATLELVTPDLRLRLDRDVAPATRGTGADRRGTTGTTGPAARTTPAPAAGRTAADGTARSADTVVKAHSVGVFLDTHPLATTPLAAHGARVAAGQTLGLLRIGALLLPVTAPADGVVERVLAPPGTAVGHGTALFALRAR